MALQEHTFLTSFEAAHYLRLSPSTLAAYRVKGSGPQYIKLGAKVVYRRTDLEAWVNENVRTNTSQNG